MNFVVFIQFPSTPQALLRRLRWALPLLSRTQCATPTRSLRRWPGRRVVSGCPTPHSATSPLSNPVRSSLRHANLPQRRCTSPGANRKATSTGEDRSRRRTICSGGQWTSPSPRSPAGSRCPPSTCRRKAWRRARLCADRIALIFIGHLETPSCAAAYLFDNRCRSPIAPLLALYTLFSGETDTFKTAIPLRARTHADTCVGRHHEEARPKDWCHVLTTLSFASALIVSFTSHCIVVFHSHPVLGVIVGFVSSYFLLLIGSVSLSCLFYRCAMWLDRSAVMYIFNLPSYNAPPSSLHASSVIVAYRIYNAEEEAKTSILFDMRTWTWSRARVLVEDVIGCE